MADSKISALPASTTPLAGTEVLPIVQSSTTKQVSVANLTVGRDITVGSVIASNLTASTAVGADSNKKLVSLVQPAFAAYATSDQVVTSTVTTKVLFGTEEYDTNSNLASSTFTATVAGYYQINTGIQVGYTTLIRLSLTMYKNGSLYKRLVDFNAYTGNSICGSSTVYLAATDYVEIYVLMNGTGTLQVNGGAVDTSWFNGSILRGA